MHTKIVFVYLPVTILLGLISVQAVAATTLWEVKVLNKGACQGMQFPVSNVMSTEVRSLVKPHFIERQAAYTIKSTPKTYKTLLKCFPLRGMTQIIEAYRYNIGSGDKPGYRYINTVRCKYDGKGGYEQFQYFSFRHCCQLKVTKKSATLAKSLDIPLPKHCPFLPRKKLTPKLTVPQS